MMYEMNTKGGVATYLDSVGGAFVGLHYVPRWLRSLAE